MNLEAVTRGENVRRALASGLARSGERMKNAKLTDALVRDIRESDKPAAFWARELGVDRTTIRYARIRKTWKHVA